MRIIIPIMIRWPVSYKKKMKSEIKTETKQIRSIHVGALNDYG